MKMKYPKEDQLKLLFTDTDSLAYAIKTSVAVFKKVPPRRLNREEFILIDKFDTLTKGLNRYQVV